MAFGGQKKAFLDPSLSASNYASSVFVRQLKLEHALFHRILSLQFPALNMADNQEAEDQPQPVTVDDENGTGEDGKDMSLRELKRNIFEVLPDSILPPPDHKVKSKTIAEQMLSQDRPQDDDDTDYSLPLSQVMTSAIEEVKHQKQAFTSKYPRIRGFHVSNYQVQGDTLKSSYSRTDEDAALLGRYP
ncbi:uncharacterized protein [Watersipora subatra]|uniref:uncharacterized protein n=2 Tax=Watersipora subatra TaxID=2589382 RepID=UPI00355C52B6